MTKITFSLLLSFVFLLVSGIFINPTFAACNFYTSMTATQKDVNWNSICTVSTVDGVDNAQLIETSVTNPASLNINTNGAITINSTGKLIAGLINFGGGNIAVQSGGIVKIGYPVYVADADGDGWVANFTMYDASGSGKRRLSLMKSFSATDCNDANDFRLDNVCCVSGTYYRDLDGDGYGAGSAIIMCSTSGYVSNNTDCYDSNANAKPGSTFCGTANRGDGSFDYNCLNGNTKCGTVYNYSSAQSYWVGQHGTGSCTNHNATCRSNNLYYYAGAATSCGLTGALCSAQTWHEEGCGDCGASPNSQYRCTSVTTGIQACQ